MSVRWVACLMRVPQAWEMSQFAVLCISERLCLARIGFRRVGHCMQCSGHQLLWRGVRNARRQRRFPSSCIAASQKSYVKYNFRG